MASVFRIATLLAGAVIVSLAVPVPILDVSALFEASDLVVVADVKAVSPGPMEMLKVPDGTFKARAMIAEFGVLRAIKGR